jgi:D-xylose reductase
MFSASAIPKLILQTGDAIPNVGLGFWKVPGSAAENLVCDALEIGYRHLDCACDYGNEKAVGAGVRKALQSGLCRRDELWITSKLWNTYHAREHVRPAVERSLSDLGVDYLDLYLIHFPIAQRYVPIEKRYPPEWFYDPNAPVPRMEFEAVPISETWGAMERLVRDGLVRNIGVCNFGCSLLRDLLTYSEIPPALLQVELHPYLTQEKLLRFCAEQKIIVTAFSPLGALSYLSIGMATPEDSVLEQPVVRKAAARINRTPAQVVLRWGVQRGTAIVPKTSHPERLRENLQLFDFEVTEEEMNSISALNQNRRFNDPGHFCEAAFNSFCPIYE